jgi:PAS domain S-box-containing protein
VAQQSIELILFRQMAASLVVPVFLVDAEGELIYVNEAAENLLGIRFDEMDRMSLATWVAAVRPRSLDGADLADEEAPLRRALMDRVPGHQPMVVAGADGLDRTIQVTAFPLLGQGGRLLGAVAMFWQHVDG